MRKTNGTECAIFKEADLPLEVVILLIGGLALLITGVLLFPVSGGALPYYENGLNGLLLIIFALQMITLGKTPFGEMRRSKLLLAVGVMTPIGPFPRSWLLIGFGFLFAGLGIVSCVKPEILVSPLTILVGVLNILGGVITLVKICIPRLKKTKSLEALLPRSWQNFSQFS